LHRRAGALPARARRRRHVDRLLSRADLLPARALPQGAHAVRRAPRARDGAAARRGGGAPRPAHRHALRDRAAANGDRLLSDAGPQARRRRPRVARRRVLRRSAPDRGAGRAACAMKRGALLAVTLVLLAILNLLVYTLYPRS